MDGLAERPKKRPRREVSNPLPCLSNLDEGTFVTRVLSFLSTEDVLSIFQVGRINRLSRLELYYCRIHGERMDPVDSYKKDDVAVASSLKATSPGNEDSSNSREDEEDDENDEFTPCLKVWKQEHPYVNPNRCRKCELARSRVEECVHCEKTKDWCDFVHCRECGFKACEECNLGCLQKITEIERFHVRICTDCLWND